MITVEHPGILSLFQDLGRWGYRDQGVAASGAYDELAHLYANFAVGNPAEAATIEMTLGGPTLRFSAGATVAMAGAPFESWIDDAPAELRDPQLIAAGSVVRFGRAARGLRGYLAVAGGFDAPAVLGSRSTHAAANLGPARLHQNLEISVGDASSGAMASVRELQERTTIRVIPTQNWVPFSGVVDARSDRTGARISVKKPIPGGEIEPEPMVPGAIQVPPDGQPIVLGPDAPVTGGYPVIGVVIRADRGVLAQSRPGTRLSFLATSSTEARRAWEDELP